jgi:hypothetical protein
MPISGAIPREIIVGDMDSEIAMIGGRIGNDVGVHNSNPMSVMW